MAKRTQQGFGIATDANVLIAYRAGVASAQRLTSGDRFLDAHEAVRATKLVPDSILHSMFVSGYQGVINARWPQGVTTTQDGIIADDAVQNRREEVVAKFGVDEVVFPNRRGGAETPVRWDEAGAKTPVRWDG